MNTDCITQQYDDWYIGSLCVSYCIWQSNDGTGLFFITENKKILRQMYVCSKVKYESSAEYKSQVRQLYLKVDRSAIL